MQVFIVYAHPEPQSFNGALLHQAQTTLAQRGHEVTVSDLYALKFDPTAGRHDFTTVADPERFRYQAEQKHAAQHQGFVETIRQEHEKLAAADVVIFQFPLWWFGFPAILKGWVDRVLSYGVAYGAPAGGSYKTGPYRGKRAMLSLTTGSAELTFVAGGRHGDLNTLLFPIQHGILHFTGMDVLPPFVAWAPQHATDEERQRYLALYAHRLKLIDRTPPLYAFR
ncbi:NAD(P)H dehydrogenase (quinone) [Catalinimonas alkaloidigena]|uniref:NAD(P)H dehydrogenase (Quinone) n=1 Tax=Catalinimonas alkaloidigena TaxID=1075417 RepID=A0A1G9F1S4_9BACT|nr:NAD(P)H-dependent oxidoreductase [Catalinimonas alkaloidigena]SDK82288.1 NAD(P)H dehydrogenase (quinone) [Catalinimonas alkaloidigena]